MKLEILSRRFLPLALAVIFTPSLTAQITVTSTADSGPGSLRQAVADAGELEFITFDTPLTGATIVLTSGQILVDKDLTIDASNLVGGITIDGNANGRIFEFAEGTSGYLQNMTLTNGLTDGNGGAILLNEHADLTVKDSTISGNTSERAGGGIYNTSGTLLIENCIVSVNSNGALYNSRGNVRIISSTISENEGSTGGAIANSSSGEVVVQSSTISSNSASTQGGAIYNSGVFTVQNSTLMNNVATSTGGGIYTRSGTFMVENSTLSGNVTTRFSGGGIRVYLGTLSIHNSTIANNSAASDGGGIHSSLSTVTVENSTFSENFADGNGGAILSDNGIFYFRNSIIAGNTADASGPDIFHNTGSINPTGVNLLSSLAGSTLTPSSRVKLESPNLAPLGDYGGPTHTMPPLLGSSAIDPTGGDATSNLSTDQRGFARLVNDIVDIGAVEVQADLPVEPPLLSNVTLLGDGSFQFDFPGPTGGFFVVYATSDLSLPASEWTFVERAAEVPSGSGLYQFTDSEAANVTQRFYIVISP